MSRHSHSEQDSDQMRPAGSRVIRLMPAAESTSASATASTVLRIQTRALTATPPAYASTTRKELSQEDVERALVNYVPVDDIFQAPLDSDIRYFVKNKVTYRYEMRWGGNLEYLD